MLNANANALAVFAAARRLPSCGFPEFVRSGGLLAYGINFADLDYRAAAFIDKISRGRSLAICRSSDPTKFELIVNLKTAKALGLTLPTSMSPARRRGDRMSAPGKLVRSSRWKSGPSKG